MTNPCDGCLVAPMCSAACQQKLWQKDQLQVAKSQHHQAMLSAPNQRIRRSYGDQSIILMKQLEQVMLEIAQIRSRSGIVSNGSMSSSSSSVGGSTVASTPSRSSTPSRRP